MFRTVAISLLAGLLLFSDSQSFAFSGRKMRRGKGSLVMPGSVTFSTAGTTAWTVPNYNSLSVSVYGAGGGGGSGCHSTSGSGASGGTGGLSRFNSTTPVVGNGGTGGAGGTLTGLGHPPAANGTAGTATGGSSNTTGGGSSGGGGGGGGGPSGCQSGGNGAAGGRADRTWAKGDSGAPAVGASINVTRGTGGTGNGLWICCGMNGGTGSVSISWN